MNVPPSASIAHLLGSLSVVQARVKEAVRRRRAADADPDDSFRGLYITDGEVDGLLAVQPGTPGIAFPDADAPARLAQLEAQADDAEAGGDELRLRRLARDFDLDELDVELLLVTLAPDLDARFERLYGYLHDDVTRRRASTGLALELCRAMADNAVDRDRFHPSGPLVGGGLVLVEEIERPFLTRSLRVPDRVTSHLLGSDRPEPLVHLVSMTVPPLDVGPAERLIRGFHHGVGVVYVRERLGAAGVTLADAAFRGMGCTTLAIDLSRVGPAEDLERLAAVAAREARLQGSGLVAGPVETLLERDPAAIRTWTEARCPVVLVGCRPWDPTWSPAVPLLVEAPVPGPDERAALWRAAFQGDAGPAFDPATSTAHFRLAPHQIWRAARTAGQQAMADERDVGEYDLLLGARAQNAAGLERLARRIEPRVGWDDLVLPDEVVGQLEDLAARARHRDRVLDDWGMGSASKGRGITALFAGDSGTGKTISAEAMARHLGLDLYVIDLSTVIDKYVGETEKNLDRIFGEADRVNAVLLFDEADAIFGKRSEVKDAQDRYANVEVAYLLQRMEMFDGLAILTTNLRANVDEAFTRRLDAIIDFPMPEEWDRQRLWKRHLPPSLPQAGDIDYEFLARAFKLSGGNVRNIALTGAFQAARENRAVGMADLIRGTQTEYRKLGHLCLEDEFGPYFTLLEPRSSL